MKTTRKLIIVLTILALFLASLGIGLQPAQAATCTTWYTVQKGDTLAKIGAKFGVSWQYLADLNNLANPNKIYAGQVLCVSTTGTAPAPGPSTIPTFSIVSVARDTSVTIQTYNFPANDKFKVLIGPYGTQGKNGIKVGTYNSGNGASKQATYPIPAELVGSKRLAIRLQSTTGSGYFAYNWFWNNTAGGGTNPDDGYTGYPYFFIKSVVRNTSVTIQGYNYPPNTNFTVLMGPMGTKGVGGIVVGSFNSGSGGYIEKTFGIPAALAGSKQIAIRTQSNVAFAYNWFWNNNAP